MNRKWWKLIYMLPITFCTLYAGGYVAQFIRNYQTWESAGNFCRKRNCPADPLPAPARLSGCPDCFPRTICMGFFYVWQLLDS